MSPQRPKRPCAAPGCSALVTKGPRCPEHSRAKRRERQRTDDNGFYSLTAWRNCRRAFLSMNPLCVDCLADGVTEPAVDVHHVVDRRRCADPYDHANLEALCKSHHSRRRK